jgi:hypothetical protein
MKSPSKIRLSHYAGLLISVFLTQALICQSSGSGDVSFKRIDDKQQVEIYVGGKLFTVYNYTSQKEKPFLFPVYAPGDIVITRGWPIDPRKGERTDHPHQFGIWFTYGDVNHLDFWGNSSAIAPDKKDDYGHISLQRILKTENGMPGTLEVLAAWDDNKGNQLLEEHTSYVISGDGSSRTIDHIVTLTAVRGPVTFYDTKEGLFAIRVDRALEMPSNERTMFIDEHGNQTAVEAIDNNGVTGMYTSSGGLKGDAVWGTRNEWIYLTGVKNNVPVEIAIFDHPKNTGFPSYFHARGYGLFSINNLGQKGYDANQPKRETMLKKGESITLRHRIYVRSGSELNPVKAKQIFNDFSNKY